MEGDERVLAGLLRMVYVCEGAGEDEGGRHAIDE
jgi:hypothetical protein